MGTTPGSLPPRVLRSSYADKTDSTPTRVLHLSGVTGENKRYTADFTVIRDGSRLRFGPPAKTAPCTSPAPDTYTPRRFCK